MLKFVWSTLAACAVALAGIPALAEDYIDPQLPKYRPINKLEGKLTLVGSETMSQVAALWEDRFTSFYPDVDIEVVVKGATNAVPAVISGEANIGLLSRETLIEEVEEFKKAKGYEPKILTPSLERIAVYVNESNPIESLTLAQLDAIFSKTLKRGEPKEITTWGALGATGSLADQMITLKGRSDTTGSQVFFKSIAMNGGEFRAGISAEKDNLALVKAIREDKNAIGFAGQMWQINGIKPVSLSWKAGETAYAVDSVGDENGTYPLVRPLQFVINQAPEKDLSPIEVEFLRYVFSDMGQEDVVKAGFHPISAEPAKTALGAVGLQTLN